MIDCCNPCFHFVVISRVIMFTASPLLLLLWLSPTHISHLVKLLHCIHMLCINKECQILLHHMSLSLMLDIFIQCPQCHICNSGKINRYLLLNINKFLYYFFKVFVDLEFTLVSTGCFRGFAGIHTGQSYVIPS